MLSFPHKLVAFNRCSAVACRFGVITNSAWHHNKGTTVIQGKKQWLSSSVVDVGDEVAIDVLSRYKSEARLRKLVCDPHQEKVALKLWRLQKAFLQYEQQQENNVEHTREDNRHSQEIITTPTGANATPQENGSAARLNIKDDKKADWEQSVHKIRKLVPRGLYIHGEVGCGKSFLMDLFFDSILVHRKRRVHFHSFMNDVHKRIHQLKQLDLKLHGRNFHVDTEKQRNPIYRVAKQISNEVNLLCFDEFQVTDVADALILSQLFTVLFQEGTVVVATGNRAPQDLYENGINRSYFLPFVALLERHCIVHAMTGITDYRTLMAKGIDSFFFINNSSSSAKSGCYSCPVEKMFALLANGGSNNTTSGMDFDAVQFPVALNRFLKLLQANHDAGVCRVHFDDMCKTNLGASDYRALAQAFPTVCIEGIPRLTVKEHDQARRFITLVDELYEARCALVCVADSFPEELYQKESKLPGNITELSDVTELTPGELFGIFPSQANGKTAGELASVIELSFAFRRAASRLVEMCSRSYWERFSRSNLHFNEELLSKIGLHSITS